MKKTLLFSFVLGLILCSCASKKMQKVQEKIAGTSVSPAQFKETIPIELNGNLIFLKVKIHDENYTFLFDTGTRVSVLSNEIVNRLSLPIVSEKEAEDAAGNRAKLKLVQLDKLSIGNIDFENITCFQSNLSNFNKSSCVQIDGILGVNIMAKAIWQLRYTDKQLIVTNQVENLTFASDLIKIPFNVKNSDGIGSPMLELRYNNNYMGDVMLDTGSGWSVRLPKALHNKLADTLPKMTYVYINKSQFDIKKDSMNNILLKNLKLGNQLKLDSFFVIPTRSSVGTIGAYFLSHYVVTLDWKSQHIMFSSAQKLRSQNRTFGYYVTYLNNSVKIGFVIEKSPATKAGIKILDDIIAVNETDVSNFTFADYCEWVANNKPSQTVKIKIQKKKSVEEYILEEVTYDSLFFK